MPQFLAEPKLPIHEQNRTAVLLMNLGTPDLPKKPAVRRFLKKFLSDQRVVELNPTLWQPILRGFILPFRSKNSAHAYSKIWLKQGSPLAVHTQKLTEALQEKFPQLIVRHAMTYGEPCLNNMLMAMKNQGVSELIVIPLYPQYAGSSTGAALDKLFQIMLKQRNMMSVHTVRSFYNDAGYIEALRQQVSAYWQQHGRGSKLMMSFHGIPYAQYEAGDPYPDECHETARLLANALGLTEKDYIVSFQSRFGRAQWVEPNTQDLFSSLPSQGVEKLDVICPSFATDCLETMEEIAIMGREEFYEAGGKQFRYIPCLNENPVWVDALAEIVRRNLTR